MMATSTGIITAKAEKKKIQLLFTAALSRGETVLYRTWIDPAVLLCEEVSKGMSGGGGGESKEVAFLFIFLLRALALLGCLRFADGGLAVGRGLSCQY